MAGAYIAKCTPGLGNVSLFWARCTETVLWPQKASKSIFYMRDKVGGEVGEMRNAIVDAVLEYDKSESVSGTFWIDDDVLVFPGCLLELLRVSQLYDCPVVSGVYFTKQEGNCSTPLIFSEKGGLGPDVFVPDKEYPVWGHGMGLTYVRTSVFKRMRDELDLGADKYGRPQWYHTSRDDEIYEDDRGTVHTAMTEDLWFCDHLTQLGIKPMITTHKHAFGWHYEQWPMVNKDGRWYRVPMVDYLQFRGEKCLEDHGYPEPQWRAWLAGEQVRWPKPGGGEIVWS